MTTDTVCWLVDGVIIVIVVLIMSMTFLRSASASLNKIVCHFAVLLTRTRPEHGM